MSEHVSARVMGVIPARWGSTRFPGKALAPICGKPLIGWVIERVRQARALDAVRVATDDARIRAVALDYGAQVAMTRADHPSGTDRVAEAVAGTDAEVVINIQGDEPLIDPDLIDRLAGVMRAGPGLEMATAAVPLPEGPERDGVTVVKVVCNARGDALYFSRLPIPYIRDVGAPGTAGLHRRHIGIYAYRRAFLERLVQEPPCALERAEMLEQLRALHLGARIRVIDTATAGIGVDTPQDVGYVEDMIRRCRLG